MSTLRKVALSGIAAGSLAILVACGSSGSGNGTPAGGGGSTGSAAGSSHGATVSTMSGPLGTYLTDGSGHTLYLFAADKSGQPTCTGTCLTYWPPFTTSAAPKPGPGVKAAMLGTAKLSTGKTIVTYAGHPLYFYLSDNAAGDTKGQGNTKFGARWWMVSDAGTAITHAAPHSGPSSGGSSGGESWG